MKVFLKLLLLCSMMAVSVSATDSYQFNVDKGSVIVSYTKLDAPYELTYTLPKECSDTKVEVNKKSKRITVSHTGKTCHTGAHFTLKLKRNISADVVLNAGAISLEEPQDLFSKVSRIHAKALAGNVSSDSNKLKIKRINYFAGAEGRYQGQSGKPSLSLLVKAGAISL